MWLVPIEQSIILIIIAVITFVLYTIGVVKLTKKTMSNRELLDIITDVTDIISGGINMEQETKNIKEFNLEEKDYYIADNELTLEELVTQNDTDEDYKDYLDVMVSLIKDRYKNYRFLRMSPTHGDYESGHLLSFTINREQVPVEYEYLFRLAVSKGLTDTKINDLFYKMVLAGKVIPLGDVEIIAGTGLSSATQAEDIMANISFMPRDYYNKHLELKAEAEKE